MDAIPVDIIRCHVFPHLENPKDQASVASTCKAFRCLYPGVRVFTDACQRLFQSGAIGFTTQKHRSFLLVWMGRRDKTLWSLDGANVYRMTDISEVSEAGSLTNVNIEGVLRENYQVSDATDLFERSLDFLHIPSFAAEVRIQGSFERFHILFDPMS
jgi:hypothetical protein